MAKVILCRVPLNETDLQDLVGSHLHGTCTVKLPVLNLLHNLLPNFISLFPREQPQIAYGDPEKNLYLFLRI